MVATAPTIVAVLSSAIATAAATMSVASPFSTYSTAGDAVGPVITGAAFATLPVGDGDGDEVEDGDGDSVEDGDGVGVGVPVAERLGVGVGVGDDDAD